MRARIHALSLVASLCLGCEGEVVVRTVPPSCAPENQTRTGCAGISSEHACHAEAWLDGVSCSHVVSITSDHDLITALTAPSPGTCLDVHPGRYVGVELSGSVHLLGRGHGCVTMGPVRVTGTSTVRGIAIDGAGGTVAPLDVQGDATVEEVHIASSPTDAVWVYGGLRLTRSTIEDAARHGIITVDAKALHLDRVAVNGNGLGIWMQCGFDGCDCASRSVFTIASSVVRRNQVVGVALVGGELHVIDSAISDGMVNDNFEHGGGAAIWGCAHATIESTRIHDNVDYGVLVHAATAELGPGLEVERNLRGIWVGGGPGARIVLRESSLQDNRGVGLGLVGPIDSEIIDVAIGGTALVSLPVLVGGVSAGAAEIGDAIAWCRGAGAYMDGVELGGSGRMSVLIDGEVAPGSSIARAMLHDGDEDKGIVQQNLPPGGMQPELDASAALETHSDEVLPSGCTGTRPPE